MEIMVGMVGGLIILIVGALVGGATMDLYMDLPSFFITVVGSTLGLLASYPMSIFKKIPVIFKYAINNPSHDYIGLIHTMATFAETARKEGLLALEDKIVEVDEIFLKKGLQLAIDGVGEELVKATLEKDLEKMDERHKTYQGLYDQWGALAPSFGMMGTLMGLIIMLKNMSDVSSIGSGMAVALITTLYGAIMANLLFSPIVRKLEILHNAEILAKQMMLEGILSLIHGENVRLLKDKLAAFLSTELRQKFESESQE